MISKKIFQRPYLYWTVGVFITYIIIDVILSGFYNTIPLILIYAKTVNWFKLGISLILTLTIGVLIAFNSVLVYIKYKERQKCKKEIALGSVGAIGGLVVGVCPLCVTGLVPLVLGLIGVSFSFASLPFQGIEIQILIVIILALSLFNLSKKE